MVDWCAVSVCLGLKEQLMEGNFKVYVYLHVLSKATTYNILVSCPLKDYFTMREGGYEVKKYFLLFQPLHKIKKLFKQC